MWVFLHTHNFIFLNIWKIPERNLINIFINKEFVQFILLLTFNGLYTYWVSVIRELTP